MIDCFCDYDPPEFYHREIRRARKPHKCSECSGTIVAGEQYEHVRGKWNGYLDTYNTCERCVDLTTWTVNNVPCVCWAHGNRIKDCWAAIEEATWRAEAETCGLRFGFLRRLVVRDRLNRKRREHSANSDSDRPRPPANEINRIDGVGGDGLTSGQR